MFYFDIMCATSQFTYLELSPDMTSVSFIVSKDLLVDVVHLQRFFMIILKALNRTKLKLTLKKLMLHGNQY